MTRDVKSSWIDAREELCISQYGIVVKTSVVPRTGAGLPAARLVTLVAPRHARHMSPALDVVEIAGAVPAPGVQAWVGDDWGPETWRYFYPGGLLAQVVWQALARQGPQTAHHLHRDAPVVHVEHPRVLHERCPPASLQTMQSWC